jgi:hypothetical protein
MGPGPRAVANHPAGATRRVNRLAASRAAFALTVAGSASGATHFRGHRAFTFVTARELALIPGMRLSRGFRPLVTLWLALPATGLPILTPAGLPPAEHISLSWTHVGSRAGAVLRRSGPAVAPRFLWECLNSRTVSWVPAPATSNPSCRFPAMGLPASFQSRVMGPTRLAGLSVAPMVGLAHSARADMCRRLGRIPEARASYEKALPLARQESERRFLARRLAGLK